MAEPTSCCVEPGGYCARVDTLFNLPGVHVLTVAWREAQGLPDGLWLSVESGCTTSRPSAHRSRCRGGSADTAASNALARSVGSAKIIRSHHRGPS